MIIISKSVPRSKVAVGGGGGIKMCTDSTHCSGARIANVAVCGSFICLPRRPKGICVSPIVILERIYHVVSYPQPRQSDGGDNE